MNEPDWNALFEEQAAKFRKDTGFMAPGKDSPAAGYAGEEYEQRRQAAWTAWIKQQEEKP